ncbi:hypothetical protein RHGRI_035041 [Rhododendron griersonianum]|uniref:MYND-type domain-containing protein n=1 Tax=Rhododendron griersonianum TaxID=479676 RepID=A0AAV6I3P0_9ERIC|nr:hypothetical protein RHGRI_035041 [Rhododendron griersonianum]
MIQRKIRRSSQERSDLFDGLPDDILLSILCKLSSTARCPSDFISILLTCKRLNRLGLHPLVLSKSGSKAFAIGAKNWSEQAHRFMKRCVAAGSVEACFTLGMIRFYCLQNRGSGASLMAKAAIRSHAQSLYSLAVIQFNGSGGSKNSKDLRAGVALCGRAAYLGHVDAIRELGHCLQDGYGVRPNAAEGRRLLVQAAARELASVLRAVAPSALHALTWQLQNKKPQRNSNLSLLSEFGLNNLNATSMEAHPVNRFLTEWFGSFDSGSGKGMRMCSNSGCGRPETRRNEFRRCSACGAVNYCSRACQAQDWKMRHKGECSPVDPLVVDVPDPLIVHLDGDDDGVGDDRTGEAGGHGGEPVE